MTRGTRCGRAAVRRRLRCPRGAEAASCVSLSQGRGSQESRGRRPEWQGQQAPVSGAARIPARPGPRAPPHLQGPFTQVLLSVCPFDQGGERHVCTFWPPGGPPLPPTPVLGRPRLLATRAAGRKDMRPRAACLPSGQRTQTPRQCGWQSSDARKGGGEGGTGDGTVGLRAPP